MSKTSDPQNDHASKGMWINPKSNLNRESGRSEWQVEVRVSDDPKTVRNLELADVVLGLNEPIRMKAKAAAAGARHTGAKSEPYTQAKLRQKDAL
jgi:hypothetical protein